MNPAVSYQNMTDDTFVTFVPVYFFSAFKNRRLSYPFGSCGRTNENRLEYSYIRLPPIHHVLVRKKQRVTQTFSIFYWTWKESDIN